MRQWPHLCQLYQEYPEFLPHQWLQHYLAFQQRLGYQEFQDHLVFLQCPELRLYQDYQLDQLNLVLPVIL